jgi:hypothetical protein
MTAVLLTGVGKVIFMDLLQWKLPFIIVTIAGWLLYVVYRTRHTPGILRYWGFRSDNFSGVLRRILPFASVAVAAFFIVGYRQGTLNLNWHILPILLIYPLWGIVQQLLVIGLVAGNLQHLRKQKLRSSLIIGITALLFGFVHYPDVWLMFGTFVLALVYGFIYLKERNVFVLGLIHGWLGALFYYTVVNRDPFLEVFGKYIN